MSNFGKYWKIGGLIAGPIARHGSVNGRYSILFERENGATLESIEAVDWASPAVRRLPACPAWEKGLPEGYGFELAGIEYHHNARYFVATVTTAKQYLGDVTGYVARIEELENQNAALGERASEAEAQLAEADETAIALYEALAARSEGKETAE